MANTYKGILTNNGKALIANATVNNKINYSHIAVGDGNGSVPTPSETRPALINEKARIALNVVEINPNNTNQIVCEAIIPTNTGGFYIRELGLYAGNTMVVNASYPPTYKPLADEGGAREIAIKIVINIKNAEVIALYLDDSLIYATREWVNNNYIRRNEIVDNLITDASNKPLSAKQGKKLQDEKFAKTGGEISNSVQLISDNSVFTVGNNADIGFVKKSLFKGAVAVGKNNSFTVVQSNNLTISKDASDTFTTLMNLDGNGVLWSIGGYLGNSSTASKLQTARKIFGQDFDGSSDLSGNITANTGMLLADSFHYIDMGRNGSDRMNFNVYSGIFNFINSQDGSIVARLSLNGIDCNAATASKLQTPSKINDIDFDGTKDINISAPMRYLRTINSSTVNQAIDDGYYLVADDSNFAGLYGYGVLEVRAQGRVIHQTYFAHTGDFRIAVRQTWDDGQSYSPWLIVGSRSTTATKLENPRIVSFSGAATGSFSYDGSANSSCILTLSNSGVVAGTYTSTIQIPSITVNDKGLITGITQQTIRSASATQAGIVQLNNTLTSDSTVQALTAAQGKKLQDEKFAKTGGEISNSVQLTSDNSVLTVGNNADIGFVKKTSFKGALAIGKSNSFTIVQSNNLTISKDASDTFTTLMNLDGNGVLWSTGGYLGNSSTASKLQTTRKIFGQDFDGSSDLSGNITANTGMLLADSFHYIDMGRSGSDRMNFNVHSGVFNFINAQNGNIVARLDSNGIDCNAATASKLKNPRKINDMNFDGTGDINITAPMRYMGNANNSTLNSALQDGFYLVSDSNILGFYGYGILEVRSTGTTIHQTYFAHTKNSNGSVAVRQSWDSGQNFSAWRSLDPIGSVKLSGAVTGNASFDESGNINIEASLVQGLGINQTWRNVTSQRAANTTYTNNRAVPIKVAIYLEAGGNNAYANISVGGEFLFAFSNTTAWGTSRGGEITVPPNTTYRVDGTFSKWSELT
ncbi:phage tail protein [Acinetobacter bereziniae]|uniref:phage tail protein n=1 Tax=Acinetobacter bereziniae TaxID=106648 RepID=UPI00301A7285